MALFPRKRHGIIPRVLERLKPYKRRILLAFLLITASQALRLLLPLITREIVNVVLPARDIGYMLSLGGGMLALTAVRSYLMYKRGMVVEKISQDMIYRLRTEIFARLQAQSFTFYDQNRIGEIMSRMTGDMEGLRGFVMNLLLTFLEQGLMFIGSVVFMASLNGTLTLVVLSLCPLLAVVAAVFNKKIRPAHTKVREQNAVLNTRTQENIAGVRVVKAFAREPHESERFQADNQKVLGYNLDATRIWSNFNPILDFVGALAVPVMLLTGGILAARGTMDLGTLIAQTGYIWMMTNPMRLLGHFVNVFAQGVTSAEKLFYYLDLGTIVRDPENPRVPARYEGRVTFEHVDMAYGDRQVLRDITFEAKPGETIALLGPTGCGKTTIINLIGRFYDVRAGSVKVDGVDVREQPLQALRRNIGYVAQETFLFSDSIAENIAYGKPDLPMARVQEAAETAQAAEFVAHMPQGYETIVGERGLGLSGGQKQRVSIARAIAEEPAILILDDATSAVDMETEAAIQARLQRRTRHTTFIIAHRVSSVLHADQILMIEDGRVVESGRHADLMALGGRYFRMFTDQYKDIADVSSGMGEGA